VQPGNSGGPVVNYQGHIVGIVSSTIAALPFIMATGTVPQNINYAVKSRTESTPHLRPSGAASHLDPFEPPAG
jgi:S1-C subfamily serine protease